VPFGRPSGTTWQLPHLFQGFAALTPGYIRPPLRGYETFARDRRALRAWDCRRASTCPARQTPSVRRAPDRTSAGEKCAASEICSPSVARHQQWNFEHKAPFNNVLYTASDLEASLP
jgi:hypothetical protein